jgi:FtsP/CotA-like multicopper oxidase with cupredoxin domain
VKRRKYRFRFLDASVSRIYELKLMSSTQGPKAAKDLALIGSELQGQYRIPDGQQCMKFLQIASDGGLIPNPFWRDSFELWPAKRREFVVDFTKYQDGTPTTKGDVIYLTNVMKMPDGRMWSNSSRSLPDPNYKVPMMKIVIGDDAPDNSKIPTRLRDLPPVPGQLEGSHEQPSDLRGRARHPRRRDRVADQRSAVQPVRASRRASEPAGKALPASQPKGSFNLWEIRNGGGGWVHPFHLHMEEHRTMMRNGKVVNGTDKGHPTTSPKRPGALGSG